MTGGQQRTRRKRSERRGHRAELLAAMLLVAKGYRIQARRYKTPVGEIDLIARRGKTSVFVEVKTRRTLDAAAEAVSQTQQARIVRAAQAWLAQNPQHAQDDLRFDAILVGRGFAMRHLKDAFTA